MSDQRAIKIKEDLNKLLNHKVYPKDIVYPINRTIALATVVHKLDDKKLMALWLMMATDKKSQQ